MVRTHARAFFYLIHAFYVLAAFEISTSSKRMRKKLYFTNIIMFFMIDEIFCFEEVIPVSLGNRIFLIFFLTLYNQELVFYPRIDLFVNSRLMAPTLFKREALKIIE